MKNIGIRCSTTRPPKWSAGPTWKIQNRLNNFKMYVESDETSFSFKLSSKGGNLNISCVSDGGESAILTDDNTCVYSLPPDFSNYQLIYKSSSYITAATYDISNTNKIILSCSSRKIVLLSSRNRRAKFVDLQLTFPASFISYHGVM